MKVKVVKASKPTYWYSDSIGEIFEVRKKSIMMSFGTRRYVLENDGCLALDVDDVKIVIKEFVFR